MSKIYFAFALFILFASGLAAQASQVTVTGDNAKWLIKQLSSTTETETDGGQLVLTHHQCQKANYSVDGGPVLQVISVYLDPNVSPVDGFIADLKNDGKNAAVDESSKTDVHAHYISCNVQQNSCSLTLADD